MDLVHFSRLCQGLRDQFWTNFLRINIELKSLLRRTVDCFVRIKHINLQNQSSVKSLDNFHAQDIKTRTLIGQKLAFERNKLTIVDDNY